MVYLLVETWCTVHTTLNITIIIIKTSTRPLRLSSLVSLLTLQQHLLLLPPLLVLVLIIVEVLFVGIGSISNILGNRPSNSSSKEKGKVGWSAGACRSPHFHVMLSLGISGCIPPFRHELCWRSIWNCNPTPHFTYPRQKVKFVATPHSLRPVPRQCRQAALSSVSDTPVKINYDDVRELHSHNASTANFEELSCGVTE